MKLAPAPPRSAGAPVGSRFRAAYVFAYLFGDYMSRVINLGAHSSAIWAALVVGVLTIVNYVGIREGKATQNFFTVLEVSGLVLIIVVGLIIAPAPAPAVQAAAGGEPARHSARHRTG